MLTLLTLVFIIAYAGIALEHSININKAASALIGAGILWTIYALNIQDHALVETQLGETLASTAQIIFFLIGAMTIVEVIDAHSGFEVITSRIRTTKLSSLMWLVSLLTFFLSAILDNLTTTIVMVSLIRKILTKQEERLLFASMIVIAANAGGAWSPIGDVTTTMLWIGGQISAFGIIKALILPSIANLALPLLVVSYQLKGKQMTSPEATLQASLSKSSQTERNTIFAVGLSVLILVPVFKSATHLPPFMGILLGLGILWLVADILHRNKNEMEKNNLSLSHALTSIDMGSIVFFIGILLAVATLEHSTLLSITAHWLDHTIGQQDLIVMLIGLASAVVDNVPLVAASIGMYHLTDYPTDSFLWEFIAYCAGTGGSILIIGSAAGVAAMGIEKISFGWYLRNISWLALLGYLAGALVYIMQNSIIH